MKRTCYVFGAGPAPLLPPEIAEQDIVIAADGGYLYTKGAGIHADAIIGDFDSLGSVPEYKKNGPVVIRLPKEKDDTDMYAALKFGLERGYELFRIFGGMGGRFDHTLANIQCLAFLLSHGARGFLHSGDTVVTAANTEIYLAPQEKGVISVFAFGGAVEGVCLRGLKYELENAVLTPDFPLGVSNEFIGKRVIIGMDRGSLLIVYPAGTKEI